MKPMLIQQAAGGIRSIFSVTTITSLYTSSCGSSKNIVYFKVYTNTTTGANSMVEESAIQANDLISSIVYSLNPEATQIFNRPGNTDISSFTINSNGTQVSGHFINPDGLIQFSILSNIHAADLSKGNLKESITNTLGNRITGMHNTIYATR